MNKPFILILCLVCVTVYFNTLNNDFVFDDKALIVYNPAVKSLRFLPLVFKKGIYDYFRLEKTNPFDIMYRPMQILTYWLDYRLWGQNPIGFHLANILLHLFNAILIYYLILEISSNTRISAITSILFLVHPIHTSVVSYIAGRADLLSCFFMLSSSLLFIKFIRLRAGSLMCKHGDEGVQVALRRMSLERVEGGPAEAKPRRLNKKIYLGLSLLSAGLALISRENALILFIFIGLILFIHSRPENLALQGKDEKWPLSISLQEATGFSPWSFIQKAKIKSYSFLLFFLLLDLFYLSLRFLIFGKAGIATHPAVLSCPLRLINFFNIIYRYISLLFVPTGLHLLRVTPNILSLLEVKAFFALLFILLYIFIIIRLRKDKLILFSMLWFLVGVLPVFSYLDGYPKLNGAMMAESWIYISSIGFFAILAYILTTMKKLGMILAISFTSFYGLLTIANNLYWRNDLLVHKRIVEYNPERNPIRRDLIDDYLFYGLYEEALSEIKKFSKHEPDSPDGDRLWGDYYFFTGKLDLAISNYNKALNRNRHFLILYRLSSCYKKMGQFDKAISLGLESLKINPYFVLNLIQLGDLYKQRQEFGLCKKYYQRAYELNPHNKALKDLLN